MKKLVVVVLCVALSILSACSTMPQAPRWISYTPHDDSRTFFTVGGPSDTLIEARLLATQEMAGRLNQFVSALTTYNSTVSYDEINRLVQEDVQSWALSDSRAVISGLEIQERWYNQKTKKWWVLASISEDEFISSYKKTLDMIALKEAEKPQHLSVLKEMLTPYVRRQWQNLSTSTSEDLIFLSTAYAYLQDNIFSSPKIVEIDGRPIELESYLEIQLQNILDTISIKLPSNQIIIQSGSNLNLDVTVAISNTYKQAGSLPWEFLLDGEYIGGDFISQGSTTQVTVLENSVNQVGTHTLAVTLSGRTIGLSNPRWWSRIHTPKVEIVVDVIEPRIQYQFEVNSDFDFTQDDYLAAKILSMLSNDLGIEFVEQKSTLGKLLFILRGNEGTRNPYGITFLHGNLEATFFDGDGNILWKKQLPKISVHGTEANRTNIELADRLTEQLHSDTAFQKSLKHILAKIGL